MVSYFSIGSGMSARSMRHPWGTKVPKVSSGIERLLGTSGLKADAVPSASSPLSTPPIRLVDDFTNRFSPSNHRRFGRVKVRGRVAGERASPLPQAPAGALRLRGPGDRPGEGNVSVYQRHEA